MSMVTEPSHTPSPAFPTHWTLEDLQEHLGGIPARRILLFPLPGTATEADALWLDDHEDRICELIDGALVEKDTSFYESIVAIQLAFLLTAYFIWKPIILVCYRERTVKFAYFPPG